MESWRYCDGKCLGDGVSNDIALCVVRCALCIVHCALYIVVVGSGSGFLLWVCSISVGAVCGVLLHMRGLSLVIQAKLGQVNDTIKTNNPWGTTFVLAYAAPHPAPIKEGAQVNPNWRVFVVFHFCKVCMLYYFATDINSWDGLVGYDAAFTRLRSGVQLSLLVLFC